MSHLIDDMLAYTSSQLAEKLTLTRTHADLGDIAAEVQEVEASHPGHGHAETGGGIGLGLYIARRMAEAHGGTVDVESSAEAGTTFSMRLPRSPRAASGASASS